MGEWPKNSVQAYSRILYREKMNKLLHVEYDIKYIKWKNMAKISLVTNRKHI